jgi:RecA-family ATPase
MFKIFPGTFTHDGRKVPIKEVKWQEEATTDSNQHRNWLHNHGHKIKFWGVPTGPENGILVLDVDTKEDNGFETLKKYHLPLTCSQVTKSGGKHFIFKYPQDGKLYGNRVKFDAGLDIRGVGGFIAFYGIDNTPIADAPDWLLNEALKNNKPEINLQDVVTIAPAIVMSILESACENIRQAAEGESNNVLNIEAYRVGQLVPSNSITYDEAFNALFKAAKDRGKPDYEAKATINSGLAGGSKTPFTSPFGNLEPELIIPETETPVSDRWTPEFFKRYDLTNMSKLRKPQLFKDWSTEDIHITTADGGTGKTTLKLCEAIALALGEPFLGFECTAPGRTLFITGEDTREKIGAMLGAIMKQMGILDDSEKCSKILNNIVVKKDSDLCLITKTKEGFININPDAINKVMQAVEDIRPKLIVFDPISSFWGSEAALNDMSKAVAKFMGILVERSNACVEVINHMGKASSSSKDMSQFAGRGGTGLPSHARVSRVLRPVFDEEYQELTGFQLDENKSAILCNVNKFSDGSSLYNKPFLIVRDGYLFSRVTLIEQKAREVQESMSDTERVFCYVKEERQAGRYPNKSVITSHFNFGTEKISKERIARAIECLMYAGHMGEKLKQIENPDVEVGGKAYLITDMEGREV